MHIISTCPFPVKFAGGDDVARYHERGSESGAPDRECKIGLDSAQGSVQRECCAGIPLRQQQEQHDKQQDDSQDHE